MVHSSLLVIPLLNPWSEASDINSTYLVETSDDIG